MISSALFQGVLLLFWKIQFLKNERERNFLKEGMGQQFLKYLLYLLIQKSGCNLLPQMKYNEFW